MLNYDFLLFSKITFFQWLAYTRRKTALPVALVSTNSWMVCTVRKMDIPYIFLNIATKFFVISKKQAFFIFHCTSPRVTSMPSKYVVLYDFILSDFVFFRILFLIKLADHEGWTSVYAAMSVLSKTLGPLAFLILPKFEQNERVSQRQRGILVGDRQRIDSKNLSRNLRFVKDYNLRTVQSQQGYWQICILYIKKYEIFVFRTV